MHTFFSCLKCKKQMTNIQIISAPSFQWCVCGSENGWIWERPITIARPLQKPNITGEGNSVMKRESLVIETTTIKSPAKITSRCFWGATNKTEKGKAKNFLDSPSSTSLTHVDAKTQLSVCGAIGKVWGERCGVSIAMLDGWKSLIFVP